ncbi:MAG: lipid A deacylase LpxR family protein [Rubrivivax sp.]|nr:lipid A deacylase LpxR family protein [Rubrivivax sp.]
MKAALALAAAVFAASTAHADDFAGKQISWDNDLWAKGRTDRWYTNGLRMTWTYDTEPRLEPTRRFREASRWLLWEGARPSLGYGIGQAMYTPRDIERSDPQFADRPWGAFLYASLSAHAENPSDSRDEFRATEVKYGIAGRYAMGEPLQKLVHQVVDSPEPRGWDQQVRTRIGLQLTHARVYRIGDRPLNDMLGLQVGFGGAVGTLRTHANLNAALMFGDLKGSNAPLMIGNEGDFVAQDFAKRAQYSRPFAFVAVNGTAVAYNYFIEGRTPYGRSAIEAKRSYTMVVAGVSLPLQRLWACLPRLVYTQTSRSSEFRNRDGGKEARQRWGTFTLNWDRDAPGNPCTLGAGTR